MTNKITSMLSRLAAQFLKPTLAILAACIVGGAWADSYYWKGEGAWFTAENWRNSSAPAADATGHTVEMQNFGAASTVTATISSDFTIGSWWIAGGSFGAANQLTIRQTAGTVTVKDNMAMGTFDNSGALYEIAGGTYAPIVKTIVGRNQKGVSKLLVNGGTAALDGDLMLGQNANATGICSVASGSLTVGATDVKWTGIGQAGYGELNVSGGSATFNGNLIVAYGAGEGVVNISGGEMSITSGSLGYGNEWGTGGKGTVNLSGGKLSVRLIEYISRASAKDTSSPDPTAYLNISGGTLQARESGTFIPAAVTTTVSGSAILDANGKNITIAATVGGTGTLRIVGGGSVDFTTAPTCTVVADADTTVTDAGNVASTAAVTIVAPSDDWASKTLPTSAGVKTVTSGNWATYANGGDNYKQTLGSDTAYVSIVDVADGASGATIAGYSASSSANITDSTMKDIYTVLREGTPKYVLGGSDATAKYFNFTGNLFTQVQGAGTKPDFVFGVSNGGVYSKNDKGTALTGNAAVVIEDGVKVQGSIVGGIVGQSHYYTGFIAPRVDGNTVVKIKGLQNENGSSVEMGGNPPSGWTRVYNKYYVIGGGAVTSMNNQGQTFMSGSGSSKVIIDLPSGASGTFDKTIVGGTALTVNANNGQNSAFTGDTAVEITAPSTVTFTQGIYGGGFAVRGKANITGNSTVIINGGRFTSLIEAGGWGDVSGTQKLVLNGGTFTGTLKGGEYTAGEASILEISSADVDFTELSHVNSFSEIRFGSGVARVRINPALEAEFKACGAAVQVDETDGYTYILASGDNTWTGDEGDGLWTSPDNWSMKLVPNSAHNVVFDSETEVDLGGTIVPEVLSIGCNANVTLKNGTLPVAGVSGSGNITLKNNGVLKATAAGVSIPGNLIIATSDDSEPAILTAGATGYGFVVAGNLTGTGYIRFTGDGDYSKHRLDGTANTFSGKIEVEKQNDVFLNAVDCCVSSAKWTVSTYNGVLNNNNSTLNFVRQGSTGSESEVEFGTLAGTLYDRNVNQHGSVIFNVGGGMSSALDAMSLTYRGFNGSGQDGRSSGFKMTGLGTFSIDATQVKRYECNAGVVELMTAASVPIYSINFNGGALKLNSAITSAADPSDKFVFANGTTAIVDDGGMTREFATAIGNDANGNATTANFIKKGAGALTLAAPPTYIGTTKVEDGVLYVINGDYTLTPDSSTAEVTTDKDGYRKFVPASKKAMGMVFLAF